MSTRRRAASVPTVVESFQNGLHSCSNICIMSNLAVMFCRYDGSCQAWRLEVLTGA